MSKGYIHITTCIYFIDILQMDLCYTTLTLVFSKHRFYEIAIYASRSNSKTTEDIYFKSSTQLEDDIIQVLSEGFFEILNITHFMWF